MPKILVGILLLFLPALTFAQASAASSRYQPATITQVKPHQSGDVPAPGEAVYEVSVKVNGITYVVLDQVAVRGLNHLVCDWTGTSRPRRREHDYLERHPGPISRGTDYRQRPYCR